MEVSCSLWNWERILPLFLSVPFSPTSPFQLIAQNFWSFSRLDWNKHRMETNAGKSFQMQIIYLASASIQCLLAPVQAVRIRNWPRQNNFHPCISGCIDTTHSCKEATCERIPSWWDHRNQTQWWLIVVRLGIVKQYLIVSLSHTRVRTSTPYGYVGTCMGTLGFQYKQNAERSSVTLFFPSL